MEINRLGESRRITLGEVIEKPYRTTLTDRDVVYAYFCQDVAAGTSTIL